VLVSCGCCGEVPVAAALDVGDDDVFFFCAACAADHDDAAARLGPSSGLSFTVPCSSLGAPLAAPDDEMGSCLVHGPWLVSAGPDCPGCFPPDVRLCRACGGSYPVTRNVHGEEDTHGCDARLQDIGLQHLRCPECGEGPGDAPSGSPAGPVAWFDDAVEFPDVWSDPGSVVCCCACGTFFVLGADGALVPTVQV